MADMITTPLSTPVKAPVSFVRILIFVVAAIGLAALGLLYIENRSSERAVATQAAANADASPFIVTDKHLLDAVRKNAGVPGPVAFRDLRRFTHDVQSANGQRIPSVRTLCGVAVLTPANGKPRERTFVATTAMSTVILSFSSGNVWITWDKPAREAESCRDSVTLTG